ncbi:shikimate 5-dehydrogenase, partial [Pseudomonas savastanoi pv. glycinea str. race 4]
MHEHEGDAQGLRYLYRLIDIDALQLDISALPQLIESAQTCG